MHACLPRNEVFLEGGERGSLRRGPALPEAAICAGVNGHEVAELIDRGVRASVSSAERGHAPRPTPTPRPRGGAA